MDDKCSCGQESTRGCHGIRDGEVYDEYYCEDCYTADKKDNPHHIDRLANSKKTVAVAVRRPDKISEIATLA